MVKTRARWLTRVAVFCGVVVGVAALPALGQEGHRHGSPAAAVPATSDQQASAARLYEAVKAGIARFARVDVALAEGYRGATFRFGDWGPAHFRNPAYVRDGTVLDAARPEGLVYLKLQDGRMVLLGAFFIAPRGQGPQPGGPITQWHHHNELGTTEMMHVWTFGHPEGPFGRSLTREALRAAMQYAEAAR
jgi:hypothetical protein